ncbi:MAG TPA: hypothetical protein VMT52_09985 [Planctomycetota bacterium]|nr:hypothetical protein [Planctomycetota bacterium]
MPSHRLILKGDSSSAEWLLEWDKARFVLKDPDGQYVFEAEAAIAHRVVEIYELYAEGKICFDSPNGTLTFKKNPAAVEEVRELVEAGLASDAEYRAELNRQSLRAIPRGLAMFFVAGGLYGLLLVCVVGTDAPPDHWIRRFRWLIRGVLFVLMCVALAGPYVCYFGLRQWLRVRRIEREIEAAGSQRHAKPDAAPDHRDIP